MDITLRDKKWDDLRDLGAVITDMRPEKKMVLVDFNSSMNFSRCLSDDHRPRTETAIERFERERRHIAMGTVPKEIWEAYLQVRDMLESYISEFAAKAKSTKRERVRRSTGDDVDIDRMLGGDPDHWITKERGAKRQLVRIGVQYGYNYGVSRAEFIKTAALGAAASDLLERLGYAVEIVGLDWATYTRSLGKEWNGVEGITQVHFRKSSDPLDPQNVLIAGFPSMCYTIAFSVYSCLSGKGWGQYQATLSKDAVDLLKIDAFVGMKWYVTHLGQLKHLTVLEGFIEKAGKAMGVSVTDY